MGKLRTPPIPGPFGPRMRVVHGLLPAWEVYAVVGVAVSFSSALLAVLGDMYVLCPDREGQYYIIDLDSFTDGEGCEYTAWGLPLAIVSAIVFLACVWAVRRPYAEWKADGLEKPRYPLTVAQETPELDEKLRSLRAEALAAQQPSADNDASYVQGVIAEWQRVGSYPAYCSWDERPLDWLSRYGPWGAMLILIVFAITALVAFFRQDLSAVWGPAKFNADIWDSYYGMPRQVATPSTVRDSNFMYVVVNFNMGLTALAGFGTFCLAAASELRKGYYFKPWEILGSNESNAAALLLGCAGIHFYDPTPLLSGATPSRQGAFRLLYPVMSIANTDWDGKP